MLLTHERLQEDGEAQNTSDLQSAAHKNKRGKAVTRQVGVIDPHYNLERVSYGLSPSGFTHRKVRRVPIQRLERRGTFWAYTPVLLDRTVDMVHTFNMIPLNAQRYVISCEMELPRYLGRPYPWQLRFGQRSLASPACRSILALSAIAERQLRAKYEKLGLTDVSEKIELFRGAIAPSQDQSPRQPNLHGPLRALFVGRDAARKGLVPTINAIQRLRDGGLDVRLTVVSGMDVTDDYVFGDFVPNLNELQQRVQDASWIDHLQQAPNERIRQMMRDHDVFILPTFDESLGWVMIEAGAEACPSITTNVFAIPELVIDGQTGTLLDLPQGNDHRWTGLFLEGEAKAAAIMFANQSLQLQIEKAIEQADQDRIGLAAQGNKARCQVAEMYDQKKAGEQLKRIYEHAVS